MEYFDFNREEFDYKYVVMLSDIDQFQHMSFANYLKLMFLASDALFLKFSRNREDFFLNYYLDPAVSQMHFKQQTSFGDEILVRVHSDNITETGFDLCYQYSAEGNMREIADGRQRFEVRDMKGNEKVGVPGELRDYLKRIRQECRERFMEVERFENHPMSAYQGDNRYFVFDKLVVFFKHTNRFGMTHPYNFLEWTSYVREAYFQETVANFREVTQRPIKMMTTKIASRMIEPPGFGDELVARLTVGRIRKVSFEMIIRFINRITRKVVCETTHTIVFSDSEVGGFAEIPEEMKRVIVHYREPELAEHV